MQLEDTNQNQMLPLDPEPLQKSIQEPLHSRRNHEPVVAYKKAGLSGLDTEEFARITRTLAPWDSRAGRFDLTPFLSLCSSLNQNTGSPVTLLVPAS